MLQQRSCGISNMPLLMGFTTPNPIESGTQGESLIYNDIMQITEYDMAVGTKCIKSPATRFGVGCVKTDKKNEIDDSK